MSNSPEPGREQWPASWASPNAPAPTPQADDDRRDDDTRDDHTARLDDTQGLHDTAPAVDVTPRRQQPGYGQQPVTTPQPAYAPAGPPLDRPAQQPGPFGAPPSPWHGQPPYDPPVPQRDQTRSARRGPGWGGVVAVGAAAAVLSSLFTLGITE